ncbi:MAG TPA: hypothetical protein DD379_16610 [Cyanobacteria bacterium UBA11162]|nr:hypothetical protein [Cyanobacteria bacterium UBA11162]
MKVLGNYLLATTLGAAVAFEGINNPATSQVYFGIEDIKVQIYDNQKGILVEEPTNPHGNGMAIFMSVFISQNAEFQQDTESDLASDFSDYDGTYSITVEGYGKGRENPAEGLVEDYKIKATQEVTLYSTQYTPYYGQYVPFILEYPCTEETTYTITVVQNGTNNIATKTIQSPYGYCYLN